MLLPPCVRRKAVMSINAFRRSSWNGSEGTTTLSDMAAHPGGGCVLLWLIQQEERTRHWQSILLFSIPLRGSLSLRSPNQRVGATYINHFVVAFVLCSTEVKCNVALTFVFSNRRKEQGTGRRDCSSASHCH